MWGGVSRPSAAFGLEGEWAGRLRSRFLVVMKRDIGCRILGVGLEVARSFGGMRNE